MCAIKQGRSQIRQQQAPPNSHLIPHNTTHHGVRLGRRARPDGAALRSRSYSRRAHGSCCLPLGWFGCTHASNKNRCSLQRPPLRQASASQLFQAISGVDLHPTWVPAPLVAHSRARSSSECAPSLFFFCGSMCFLQHVFSSASPDAINAASCLLCIHMCCSSSECLLSASSHPLQSHSTHPSAHPPSNTNSLSYTVFYRCQAIIKALIQLWPRARARCSSF